MAVPLTDTEKQEFLDCLRAGGDQAICARRIGSTGTKIKRMLNETGRHYDPDFARQIRQAIAERDPEAYETRQRVDQPEPARTTLQGFTKARFLEPDQLEAFLDDVRTGTPRDLAARAIGTSLHQINLRCQTDHDFREQYDTALDEGYPNFKENLRTLAYQQAVGGNYNALKDLLLVHAEEYDKLRTSRHEHGGIGGQPIRVLAAALPMLPDAMLKQIAEAIQNGDSQKALEAAKVIDQ